jgi:3-phenylpropionate/trans-cinnamate dioxygenase ferredoxin component
MVSVGGPMTRRKLVARVKKLELPPGTMKRVDYPPFDVLIVNLDGVPYAIDDTCNHAGESLFRGELDGCQIACPAHGYIFDVRTGRLLLPAGLCDNQRTFDVTVEGDDFAVYDEVLALIGPETP